MNLDKTSLAALKLAVMVGVPSLAFALYWLTSKKEDEEDGTYIQKLEIDVKLTNSI